MSSVAADITIIIMSTKQKTKKVKAVQQKKKLFRANEPLLSVFMWGVNYSVSAKI